MPTTQPPSRTEPRPDLAAESVPQQVQGPGLPKMSHATPVVSLLEAAKPIAFNINFARITGDTKAALLLSQLVYWTRRGADVLDNDGWVFKTREQLEEEIGLSKHEQVTARNILIGLGLMEEARTGAPARNCYRVMPAVLGAHLAQLVRSEPVQWSLLDMRSDTQHIRTMLGRQFAFYRVLMQVTSTCTAAVYLSKALAIQRRFTDRPAPQATNGPSHSAQLPWDTDWFRMAVDSTQADTGLSPAQQRDAKHKLCQIGLLHEAMMTHPRKQLYLRIDMQMLNRLLTDVAQKPARQNRSTGNGEKMHGRFIGESGEWLPVNHSPATYDFSPPRDATNQEGIRTPPTRSHHLSQDISTSTHESPNDPSGSQNRTTRMPDSDKLDVRFSQGRWPVLARPKSGFSTPSCPVLTGLHAHASRAGQDYKEDYIKTTTTQQAPSKVDTASPNPDISQSKTGKADVGPEARSVGLASAAVVVVSSVKPCSPEPLQAWIWPELFTKVEQEQGIRILSLLAKTGQLEDAQNILDELAGWMATGGVKSNLSYLRRLVTAHQSTPGGLVYERGPDVRLRRERLAAIAAEKPKGPMPGIVSKAQGSGAGESVVLTDAAKSGLAKAREMLATYKKRST